MLTPYSPKTGLYWPPVVARVGRRPWRCRCGLPYWWPPVLAAAVAVRRAGVRPWWLVCWLAVLAAGVRPPCWRSVRGWCPSVAVVAVFVAAGGLSAVRRSAGPPWSFRGPWRPVWALCACLTFGSIPPPLVARRRWCAVLVLACLVCAVGGRGGRVAGRPCWCAGVGVIAACRGPWSVSLAASAGRLAGGVAGGVIAPCLIGPCAVAVRPCWCPPWRSLAVSVRPCWCAGVRSVAGVRFLPCSVAVVALLGRRWCWCPSLVLAARVGLVLGLAGWLAVWALPVVAAVVAGGACACGGTCLSQRASARAGWRWAVCGAFRGGGVRLPCLWWSLLVSHQRRPWPSV